MILSKDLGEAGMALMDIKHFSKVNSKTYILMCFKLLIYFVLPLCLWKCVVVKGTLLAKVYVL